MHSHIETKTVTCIETLPLYMKIKPSYMETQISNSAKQIHMPACAVFKMCPREGCADNFNSKLFETSTNISDPREPASGPEEEFREEGRWCINCNATNVCVLRV